ncbi:hypothetical protein ACS0TY_006377 [Phlomoides rotata]
MPYPDGNLDTCSFTYLTLVTILAIQLFLMHILSTCNSYPIGGRPLDGRPEWILIVGIQVSSLLVQCKDVLAIPISTVASELAFSTCGRFISPHRSRLHHNTLEALMCSQDWLWTEAKENGATPSECCTFHDDVDDETNEEILGTDTYHGEL